MKKFDMSKVWVALAVVVFGCVCIFLPTGKENLTANINQTVNETIVDSNVVDSLEVEE